MKTSLLVFVSVLSVTSLAQPIVHDLVGKDKNYIIKPFLGDVSVELFHFDAKSGRASYKLSGKGFCKLDGPLSQVYGEHSVLSIGKLMEYSSAFLYWSEVRRLRIEGSDCPVEVLYREWIGRTRMGDPFKNRKEMNVAYNSPKFVLVSRGVSREFETILLEQGEETKILYQTSVDKFEDCTDSILVGQLKGRFCWKSKVKRRYDLVYFVTTDGSRYLLSGGKDYKVIDAFCTRLGNSKASAAFVDEPTVQVLHYDEPEFKLGALPKGQAVAHRIYCFK